MSLQQFCLRWNNHQPNFVSVFTSLLNNESLVDVTLAAEGKHLQAHKVVLSACSSYFQTLFSVNPCQHPIVILKDVKYDDLKTMVDFMYYGEVNVSQEQLPAILKTADTLKIKGLAEMPEHHFRLSKSMSGSSTERTDLPATGESVWSSDAVCRSSSPASPSSRRKRLRKTSTGSGSGSTEVTSEEVTNEITVLTSHTVKPEPYHTLSEDGGHSDASLNRNTSLEASTDSEPPRQISQESVEDEQHSLHMTNESSIHVGENMVTNVDTKPLSAHHQSLPSQGTQWTPEEHGYPQYPLSSCQTSLSVRGSSSSSPFCSPEVPAIAASCCDPSQYSTHQSLPSCSLNNYGSPSIDGNMDGALNTSRCSSPLMLSPPGQNHPIRRRRNPQADENFLRALEAVRLGGIGFCKAARMYGVNNRTLWLEYKKRGYPVSRPSVKSRVKYEAVPCSSTQVENATNIGSPHVPYHQPSPVMDDSFSDTRHVDYNHQNSLPSRLNRYQEMMAHGSPPPVNIHATNFSTL